VKLDNVQSKIGKGTYNRTHLEKLLVLRHNMSRGALLLALPYIGRSLDDLTELVGEIVLASHRTAVYCDTWPDRGGWDRKNGQNHPLRTGIFVGKPKEM